MKAVGFIDILYESPFAVPGALSGESAQSGASPVQSDTAIISRQALAALGVDEENADAQSATVPPSVHSKTFDSPTAGVYGRQRVASRVSDGSAGAGDSASFSDEALSGLAEQIAGNDAMSTSKVTATLVDGNDPPTVVTYSNANGAVTWNGNTLNLKGFADTLKDDVVIRNNGDGLIDVYNLTTGQKMTLNTDGTRQLLDGKPDPASIVEDASAASELSTGLFINNRGKAANTSDGNDIIINRQEGSNINAGAGDDKIFNFASSAVTLDGGEGNDAVYSVGLGSGTTIDVSSGGNGYVKLLGNMTGGSILLGDGQNYVDASGKVLAGVTITDGSGAEASAIIAKSMTERTNVTLNAAQASVDVGTLQSSRITFGEGANSLVADKVSGKSGDEAVITSRGTNTYKLGTVNFAQINSQAAKSDALLITGNVSDAAFHLGEGNNLLDASGKTLTAVTITSEQSEASATTILAASIVGRNAAAGASSINLAGSASGNTITVTKAIKNATISTGDGAGKVSAGSVEAVELSMGGPTSTKGQVLRVYGRAATLNYTGSQGDDNLLIQGAVSNSSLDLGDGDNAFTARNAKGALQNLSNTNITASGSGATSITIGSFAYGAGGNAIDLGSGANLVTMGKISGSGAKGLIITVADTDQTQTVNVNGSASHFTYNGSGGIDLVTVGGALKNSLIDLGDGNNTFSTGKAGVTNTNILASGAGSNALTMGNYTYGTEGNLIELGSGSNTLSMGAISGKGTAGLTIDAGSSGQTQNVTISGSVNYLSYEGSSGDDKIQVAGGVSNSTIELGEGNNSFTTARNRAVSNSNIFASGQGANTLDIGSFAFGADGNTINLGSGLNTLTMGSVSGKGKNGLLVSVLGNAGTQTSVTVNGSADYLSYEGSAGADSLSVSGKVANSSIDLGGGTNTFSAGAKATVSNTNISAGGQSSTSISMGNVSFGADGNSISLGAGVNSVSMGKVSGKGQEGLLVSVSGNDSTRTAVTVNGSADRLKYDGSSGADSLNVTGNVANSTIDLSAGVNSFSTGVNATVSNTDISAVGQSSTSINMGNVSFGADGNSIILGSGANSVSMGSVSGKGLNGLDLTVGGDSGTSTTLNVRGAAKYMRYTGSAGSDEISVSGAISDSEFDLLGGQNSLVTAHDVKNTDITAMGEGSTTVSMRNYTAGADGNLISLGKGVNEITINTVVGGKGGITIASADEAEQSLSIIGSAANMTYMGGSGADKVAVLGSVTSSDIRLGAGNNVFTAATAKTRVMDSYVSASGAGSNTILINEFTSTKKGVAAMDLGDGNDSVTVSSLSGNSTVNAGGGSANALTFVNADGASIRGAGGGDFTIGKGKNLNLNFSASSADVNLIIQASLAGSDIALGGGSTRIGAADGEDSSATVSKTKIKAGAGNVKVNLGTLSGSSIDMNPSEAESAGTLDLKAKSVNSSSIDLSYGNSTVSAQMISGSTFTRTVEGTLELNGGTVSGATFNLTGQGSDSFTVTGDMNAKMTLGAGADEINVSGALSGNLNSETDMTITSGSIANLNAVLGGANNLITVSEMINSSTLHMGDGTNRIVGAASEPAAEGEERAGLQINASNITAGGLLDIEAENMNGSVITVEQREGDESTLSLKVADTLKGSTVNMGAGNSTVSTTIIENSNFNRTAAGTLLLNAESMDGGGMTLTGAGSDSITISGDMRATMHMGAGADQLHVGGTLSGGLKADDHVDVKARLLDGLSAAFNGATSRLEVTDAINNSTLNLGDGDVNLVNELDYTNTHITGGDRNYVFNAGRYEGGSITFGNGNNLINVTDALSAHVTLGTGTNSVGLDGTLLEGFSFTGTGSNTIRGTNLIDGSVSMGGQGRINQLLVSGVIDNTTIELNGGENTVGGAATALNNTTITGTAAGDNRIQASSMTGGGINLGQSNDSVDIYGAIDGASINLGAGANTLRNTRTAAEAGSATSGHGSALGNSVSNSTIVTGDSTNIYLGAVSNSAISGTGENNINMADLRNSTLDASGMAAGNYIGIQSAQSVEIAAGTGGSINIGTLARGSISDEQGQNSITVGTLDELSSIRTGELINSSSIHVNTLDGTLDLANYSYGGVKRDNITVGQTPYAGSVLIEGARVDNAGVQAPVKDSSGFGLDEGELV